MKRTKIIIPFIYWPKRFEGVGSPRRVSAPDVDAFIWDLS
jgi:hypothetical protein